MTYLILSIACSSIIVVLFKLFKKYEVHQMEAIITNYFTCLLVGILIDVETIEKLDFWNDAGSPYILFLGVLFITGFNIVAATVKHFGMGITTIFQKLPFVVTVIYSIWAFNEDVTTLKILGILLCILSVFLSYSPSKSKTNGSRTRQIWMFCLPLLTFLTGALVEITLLKVQRGGIYQGDPLHLTSLIFGLAGTIGVLSWVFLDRRYKRWSMKTLIAGISLGVPNFFSIYFLLKLIEQGWDGSTLFPINNVGILLLSGLVAVFYFKEELSKRNAFGYVIAIVGLLMIFFASTSSF